MIVSLPVDTTSHACSEPSTVRTLDDMIRLYGDTHWLDKGIDLRSNSEGKIYRQSLTNHIKVSAYKATDVYKVGDVVVYNGHHHLITSVTAGKKNPYQPEEYTDNEASISNWKAWTGRYFKVKKGGTHSWTVGDRVYTFYYSHCQPCKGGTWKAWDRTTNGCYSSLYECMHHNSANSYTSAKDIIGLNKVWGGGGSVKEPTLMLRSAVSRGEYWYIRTWVDYPVKYHAAVHKYSLKRIYSPKEINGFRYNRMTDCMAVFDDKNYTKGVFTPASGYVDFSFVTTGWCDTVALGRVYGKYASLEARDENNNVLFSVNDYPINNEMMGTDQGQDANVILYSDTKLPPNTHFKVTIKAGWVSVGRILAGKSLKLGFTNTIFDNGFKDFSPREQDQWGNILYRNGVRVYVHSGTVDLPIKEYDALNKAFMYIGGQEMIINSSDTMDNTPPNSVTIFQSTMFIGRFTAFKQKTRNVGDLMDSVASYNFSCEESI